MQKDINNKEWYELCEWVETNIFNYSKEQKLQKQASLVLRGLQKGKAVANNTIEDNGLYPLNVILMTFKANKGLIQNALINKDFDSERNKMLFVCAIIRDKINDVYSRYLKAIKTQEKVEIVDTSTIAHQGAEYQTTERKINKRLEDLW